MRKRDQGEVIDVRVAEGKSDERDKNEARKETLTYR
jgi:hypothetical protein